MKLPETKVTVIIPTHNRMKSIVRLLEMLAHQTYPLYLMEVIVVANSCSDQTIFALKNYDAPFAFKYAETSGNGPAVPRNRGASMASGSHLIFMDDDIEPSAQFVEAHVNAAAGIDKAVVIGYLPYVLPAKADLYRLNLRAWWENKFAEMQAPGYRFRYTDLLSGNFSISAELFKACKGFVTGLTCRDDYELGIRLMAMNAQFIFSKEAWGFHNDVITDLDRSLRRKVEEGKIDVRLWKMHPAITNAVQDAHARTKKSFLDTNMSKVLLLSPTVSDAYASYLRMLMNVASELRFHALWKKLNGKLHTYWYYRGLLNQLGTKKNLMCYLDAGKMKTGDPELTIDLEKGMDVAEKLLDEQRPAGIIINYGPLHIGTVAPKAGIERLKGIHLTRILATDLSWELAKTLALADLSKEQNHDKNVINGETTERVFVIKKQKTKSFVF